MKGRSKLLKCFYCVLSIFNKSLPRPLAFRVKKRPTIPVRGTEAALKGLVHSAGCTTANLLHSTALYLTGGPHQLVTLITPPPSPAPSQPRQPFPTPHVQKGFSNLVNALIDKSVLAGPHFFVFFRAFKMVHDYLP